MPLEVCPETPTRSELQKADEQLRRVRMYLRGWASHCPLPSDEYGAVLDACVIVTKARTDLVDDIVGAL